MLCIVSIAIAPSACRRQCIMNNQHSAVFSNTTLYVYISLKKFRKLLRVQRAIGTSKLRSV